MQHPAQVQPVQSSRSSRPPLARGGAVGAVAGAIAAVLMAHTAASHLGVAVVPGAHQVTAVAAAPGRLDADQVPAPTLALAPAAAARPAPTAAPAAVAAPASAPQPATSVHRSAPVAAAPVAAAPAAATAPRTQQASSPSSAAQTLALVNHDRASAGLPALSLDPALARAAAEHASQNAANDQMSHNGLQSDVAQQGASWRYLGECLGQVRPNPDAGFVNSMWMQSSEHRPIIMGSQYTRAGVGWARAANGDWFVSLIVAG